MADREQLWYPSTNSGAAEELDLGISSCVRLHSDHGDWFPIRTGLR